MTLSMIVTLLIEEFLPEMQQKYQFQMSKDYRSYNKFVPEYLQGRPPKVIRHCMERKLKAKSFVGEDITDINAESGQFNVASSSGKVYKVNFDMQNGNPSCECKDWIRHQMPCKHFFAVFNNRPRWKWDSLPASYLKGAYLSQDSDALTIETDDDLTSRSVCDHYRNDDILHSMIFQLRYTYV